jgi:anthranilate synthase/aminodeoxychorismate synthase-like glutamine amidotransferase
LLSQVLLVIDNYDSFTYNLVQYVAEEGAVVRVLRNDAIDVAGIVALAPEGILISPGPGTPDEAGVSLEVVRRLGGRIPIFGVCLGHQTLGQVYGGRVVRAPRLMHGRTSPIHHAGAGVFAGLPSPIIATRYHSLIVERASLPDCLTVTAETTQNGERLIMGLEHKSHPVYGVQFHPESIASEHGHALLANFLEIAGMAPRRRNVGIQRHAA